MAAHRRSRLWLHGLLLVLTLLTTSATGARLDENFRFNRPFLVEDLLAAIVSVAEPWTLVNGLRRGEGGIYEVGCHEGNIGLRGILAGARVQERQ